MRSIFAFSFAAVVLGGCSSFAATPSTLGRSQSLTSPMEVKAAKPFTIDGTMYAITDFQEYQGIFGGVQAYTGRKPKLLGSIAGPTSGVNSPYAIAADKRGNVFVANGYGDDSCQTCSITEYQKNQYGDITPIAMIQNDAIGWVDGLALDPHGDIVVAGQQPKTEDGVNGVYTRRGGTYHLARRLDPHHIGEGVAIDSHGQIYVSTAGNGYQQKGAVEVFAAGKRGSSRPIGTIAGGATGMFLPTGVAIDASGNIYVAQLDGNDITVFPAGSTNGDVRPIRTIAGDQTELNRPSSLSFDKHGNLFVAEAGQPYDVLVFAPGAENNVTPIAAFTQQQLQYQQIGITVFPQNVPGP